MNTLKPLGLIVLLSLPFGQDLIAADAYETNSETPTEEVSCKPTLSCPQFVWLKPSESTHPDRTGYATGNSGGPGCAQPIVTYRDEIYVINACHKVYTRIWTATDPFDNSLVDTCHQTIKQVDEVAPIFKSEPEDIMIYTDNMDPLTNNCTTFVNWDFPTVYDNHILQSVTQTITSNGVQVNLTRGDYFPAGTYKVTYVANDFCGNFSSVDFTINIMCADCHLSCPADVVTTLNSDISPATLGSAVAFSGNNNCGSLTSSYYLDSTEETGCNGQVLTTRTWYGVFANMPHTTASCVQLITIQDNSAVQLHNCPTDLNVVDNFTPAHWEEPTAVASDNSNVVTLTANYGPGNLFPVGITTIIYTARDACGNEATCSFKVSVLANASYTDCPADIELSCNSDGTATVNYDPPSYKGSCTTCYGGGFLTGFIYIGSYDGSDYYCSRNFSTYHDAQKQMAKYGGHLATISSQGENDFIANHIGTPTALIGLSDVANEGHFVWDDGSPVTYTNWFHMQPNDYNNQDFVEIQKNSGQWNDVAKYSKLEFVMEIPCQQVKHLGGPKPGDTLRPGTYTVTYQIADGCGLNDYCTFDVTVKAGLSMVCQDDIFVEVGSAVNEISVVWDTPSAHSCCADCTDPISCVTVTQIAGPVSGSKFFRQSKTTISYQAEDLCGNTLTCSFDVLVDINTSTESRGNANAGSTIGMNNGGMEEKTTTNPEPPTLETSDPKVRFRSSASLESTTASKFYPNPMSDLLYIEIVDYKSVKALKLIDQYGRLLLEKQQRIQGINTVDVSQLEKGMYYLQIDFSNKKAETKSIVKL